MRAWRRWLGLAALGAAALGPARARAEAADEAPYYFYQGRDYGSEAMVQPLRMIVNSGYGIMQLDNRSASVVDVDYAGTSPQTRLGAINCVYNVTYSGTMYPFKCALVPTIPNNEGLFRPVTVTAEACRTKLMAARGAKAMTAWTSIE